MLERILAVVGAISLLFTVSLVLFAFTHRDQYRKDDWDGDHRERQRALRRVLQGPDW